MKWVTRQLIRVNRLATTWLSRRFIDPQAVFLFIESDQVIDIQQHEGAQRFNTSGATYPHKDNIRLVFIRSFGGGILSQRRDTAEIARFVRGVDFLEEIALTPESTGVWAINTGRA